MALGVRRRFLERRAQSRPRSIAFPGTYDVRLTVTSPAGAGRPPEGRGSHRSGRPAGVGLLRGRRPARPPGRSAVLKRRPAGDARRIKWSDERQPPESGEADASRPGAGSWAFSCSRSSRSWRPSRGRRPPRSRPPPSAEATFSFPSSATGRSSRLPAASCGRPRRRPSPSSSSRTASGSERARPSSGWRTPTFLTRRSRPAPRLSGSRPNGPRPRRTLAELEQQEKHAARIFEGDSRLLSSGAITKMTYESDELALSQARDRANAARARLSALDGAGKGAPSRARARPAVGGGSRAPRRGADGQGAGRRARLRPAAARRRGRRGRRGRRQRDRRRAPAPARPRGPAGPAPDRRRPASRRRVRRPARPNVGRPGHLRGSGAARGGRPRGRRGPR